MDNFDTVPETLYIVAMRIHSRRLLVGTLVLVPFLMLGCAAASDPQLTDSPVQTVPTPVFASNEEALAAATQAYAAYINMSDQISNDGGLNPERITPLVAEDMLASEIQQFVDLNASGLHSTGLTSLHINSVQSARYSSARSTEISLYVCEDVAGVDVLDSSGRSMVSPTREPVMGFVARLVVGPQSQLVVASRDVWTGRSFC